MARTELQRTAEQQRASFVAPAGGLIHDVASSDIERVVAGAALALGLTFDRWRRRRGQRVTAGAPVEPEPEDAPAATYPRIQLAELLPFAAGTCLGAAIAILAADRRSRR
jgi:hypothetical protein